MECAICRNEIEKEFVILNCSCHNSYHGKCIEKWIKKDRSCPTCRKRWKNNEWMSNKERLKLIKIRLNNEFIGSRRFNYSLVFN